MGVRTLAVLVALTAACSSGEQERPLSALLITLDTTRADALSCYGGRPGLTPVLDGLASEGVLYEAAYAVAPLTLPAHASMLTGLYPIRHSVRDNGLWPLPGSADTLAEAAQRSGFETAAFVAAVVLDASFGLDQGFDTYDVPERGHAGSVTRHAAREGAEVVDAALAWLDGRDEEKPFFLWVHLFDPHGPYEPPPQFRGGAAAGNAYLGEVASMDYEIGRIVERLRSTGKLDDTFVFVVADHGEAFGEHHEHTHGSFLYQSTMRVPTIVRYPDGYRAGERSTELTSAVDVYPTLCEAMGLSAAPGIDGASLFRRRLPEDRGVYMESYSGFLSFGWSPLTGWVSPDGKYLHSSDPQFFALATDPAENENAIGANGEAARESRAAIEDLAALPRLDRDDSTAIDDGLVKDIQKLGYTASGKTAEELPHPLAPSELPSPASMAASHFRTLQGMEHMNRGEPAKARAIFEEVVRENSANSIALGLLGTCLIQEKRYAEAIGPLTKALKLGPPRADNHYNLGLCFMEVGRTTDGIESFERAVVLDSGHAPALRSLVRALERDGRGDEAAPYRARLTEATSGG